MVSVCFGRVCKDMSEEMSSQTERGGAGLGAWPVGAGGAEGPRGLSVRAGAAVTAGPCEAAGCPGPVLLLPVLLRAPVGEERRLNCNRTETGPKIQ